MAECNDELNPDSGSDGDPRDKLSLVPAIILIVGLFVNDPTREMACEARPGSTRVALSWGEIFFLFLTA